MTSLALLLGTLAFGCMPYGDAPAVDTAVLFSINPNVARKVGAPGTFHGYPILGKLLLAGRDKVDLLAALAKGKADKPEYGAKCFIPRHGLRLMNAGSAEDLVICFQCNLIETYRDDDKCTRDTVDDAPRVVFNRILSDANLPIVE